MKIKLLSLILFSAILFFGCRKFENPDLKVEPVIPELKTDEVGISGTILNGDGFASAGTPVIVDGNTVVTDAAGKFNFVGKVSNPDKVIVRVDKAGNFKYSKTLVVENNAVYGGLRIYLQQEVPVSSFNSANGGTVSTSYATLTFQANSFVKEDGSAYQGFVIVKMPPRSLLEPFNKYPGDGRAVTTTGEKVVIDPWAGFNVEVYAVTGERLKLSKAMNYSFDMGWTYVYAPNTLKMWIYNDAEGNWTESGLANRSNQYLTGTTINLSYLAWGIPYQPALLRAYVRDKNLNVATNFLFRNITEQFGGGEQSTNINSKGIGLVYIPAVRTGKTAIFTPCDNRIALLSVSPISVNGKGNQIFEVDLTPYLTTFSGTVEDCSFVSVKGRAEFEIDGVKYSSEIKNGAFTFSFMSCSSNSGTLTIYNEQNGVIHTGKNIGVSRGYQNKYPPVSTCTTPQKGTVTFVVDGTTYTFQTPQDEVSFQNIFANGKMTTVLSGGNTSRNQSFYITYQGESAGNFNIYTLALYSPNESYMMGFGYSPGTISVSKYKNGNILIDGNFKSPVTLKSDFSKSTQVTGTFNITR